MTTGRTLPVVLKLGSASNENDSAISINTDASETRRYADMLLADTERFDPLVEVRMLLKGIVAL